MAEAKTKSQVEQELLNAQRRLAHLEQDKKQADEEVTQLRLKVAQYEARALGTFMVDRFIRELSHKTDLKLPMLHDGLLRLVDEGAHAKEPNFQIVHELDALDRALMRLPTLKDWKESQRSIVGRNWFPPIFGV